MTFPRATLLLCPVCVTGQLWSPLAITVSLFGSSPSWPTFLAHSLTFLRVLPLDSLFDSLPRILFDASLHSHLRFGSRPRTRQPLWWNDACFHPLVARNGSWCDFRRSGSPEDQARFHLLRQQFQSTARSRPHFWNEWLGSVTSLSRLGSQSCLLSHPPHLPVPCCYS